MTVKSKDIKQISDIIFRYLDRKDYRLLIFGSRAVDKASKFSDCDIGIEGKKE